MEEFGPFSAVCIEGFRLGTNIIVASLLHTGLALPTFAWIWGGLCLPEFKFFACVFFGRKRPTIRGPMLCGRQWITHWGSQRYAKQSWCGQWILWSTPNLFRPALISLWETASNAFARSRNTTLSLFLLRLACFCIRCNRNPFSEQAGASMKPQCRGLSGTPFVTLWTSVCV
jgi:hypothetical protein